MKTALITGITGQDGSFLAELLLEKGYDVHGTIRRSSTDYRERIAHLEGRPRFHLHYADLGDSMSIIQVVGKVRPDEIYNLAAQSHVQVSFDAPEFTADVDATGVLRILEAVRLCGLAQTCRIYQASTSELYGKVEEVPQNEKTHFCRFLRRLLRSLNGGRLRRGGLALVGTAGGKRGNQQRQHKQGDQSQSGLFHRILPPVASDFFQFGASVYDQ